MNNINLYSNFIYTRKVDLDLEELRSTSHFMYQFIKDNFQDDGSDFDGQHTVTEFLYNKYNLLLYPLPGLHNLYNAIKETFHSCNLNKYGEEPYKDYYVQCWLNFYQKGQFIDWHTHGTKDFDSWHGFYCLDVEPDSSTTYRVNDLQLEVKSEDNLLVLSRSGEDLHRSSEWHDDTRPRITIAFDIVPAVKLVESGNHQNLNHWIPI